MAKIVKEVILIEDLMNAFNNLPSCPNRHKNVYDKKSIINMIKNLPSKYIEINLD